MYLHKVNSLGSNQLLRYLFVQRIDHAWVRNDESAVEIVRLEDCHVARDEVANVLADQVELVDVGPARPEGLSLKCAEYLK
jgi:hypothetical protein